MWDVDTVDEIHESVCFRGCWHMRLEGWLDGTNGEAYGVLDLWKVMFFASSCASWRRDQAYEALD